MNNLQLLRNKVSNKAKVIVTPFTDGTVTQELANGWRKMRLDQVLTRRSNVGTAILAREHNRVAFVNISDTDFALYGEYLVEGRDYNDILEAIGETKKGIVHQLSLEPFYPTQQPVKYSDADGNLTEALTKDGNPYFKRGIIAEVGALDIWGTNEVDSDTGYAEFAAFAEMEAEGLTEVLVPENVDEPIDMGA
tara:strand:- start:5871 stop:6449 length:579 start_codon:yes stop_codon:yes gene_type:complete